MGTCPHTKRTERQKRHQIENFYSFPLEVCSKKNPKSRSYFVKGNTGTNTRTPERFSTRLVGLKPWPSIPCVGVSRHLLQPCHQALRLYCSKATDLGSTNWAAFDPVVSSKVVSWEIEIRPDLAKEQKSSSTNNCKFVVQPKYACSAFFHNL